VANEVALVEYKVCEKQSQFPNNASSEVNAENLAAPRDVDSGCLTTRLLLKESGVHSDRDNAFLLGIVEDYGTK
jgi:hypothetical protein